ncbi:MAG: hypothetical protein COT17_01465 [Elusimicrobia bacterium CG08_land_8_20_14_0_20_51_18]|nr:MAG: hypothetical protein COT17_01465 [Elusimicrobia bacterium CG08_land_8_20_14_0_20_51_18]
MSLKKIEDVFAKADAGGRKALTEVEVYGIFKELGLNVPEYLYSGLSSLNPAVFAEKIVSSLPSEKVALKIVSHKTLHKTESGGVKIVAREKGELENTLKAFLKSFKDLDGILACRFLEHSPFSLGEELLLGARSDDAFGPVITLGPGGTNAESLIKSLKTGIAPSVMPAELAVNGKSWDEFLGGCWIWAYCAGNVRGSKKLAENGEILKWLEAFSYLVKEFRDGGHSPYAIEEIEVNPLCVYKGRFFALDGVLRFRKAEKKERIRPSKKGVSGILKPQTVGIVGVSEKKMNMARIILNNVLKAGFKKEKIFLIKDGVGEIDGVKCYKSAFELPEELDMYVVAVPSDQVPGIIKDASDSGKVNGIVLISGGMGEKAGSEDLAASVVKNIAAAKVKNPDFALSGGNSLGIVLNESRVNTLFIPEYKMEYPLGENPNMAKTAFVSQSGAFVISTLSKMPQLKPAYSVTVGNQQDITVVDYVERLIEEDLKVILVYIEGFKYMDGLNLVKAIEKAKAKGKDVIVYKAGRTETGQKAVMGHTASIAGNYLVTKLLLEKAGALVCEDFDEFCDLSFMFSYFADYKVKNGDTFFISNAGFESAGMADSLDLLKAAPAGKKLTEELEKTLKEHRLDAIVDVKNPMDVTPMATDAAIEKIILKALEADEFSGAVVAMIPLTAAMNTLPKGENWPDDLQKSFIMKTAAAMKELRKPVVFCVGSGSLYEPYCALAVESGMVVFRSADRAVKMYEKFVKYKLEK